MKITASLFTCVLFATNQAFATTSSAESESVQNIFRAEPQACGDPRLLQEFHRLWNGNATVTNHFYTATPGEESASKSVGYVNEGVTGWIWPPQVPQQPQTVPFFRLWNEALNNSFYTASLSERNAYLTSHGYIDEGFAGYVYLNDACGGKPLWRMWSQANRDSFYTMSTAERDRYASVGYITIDIVAYLIRY
ncbi:hypothetical protein GALMADRAFT_1328638 [Galerina marginata CBS 339.88]|uniref:DUF5648 domain-containing protein n=1 Tax=Galerina marginata (strain CBS 339.88) TaxID=685588 RepID=A0A067T0J6_GALM3|nr:hypothetical protein GALMADRAFT_1328638 [Galerina marginata CBS 339.88]